MKVLSVLFIALVCFSSIFSLKLRTGTKDFTRTCKNFYLFNWATLGAECQKRDGSWIPVGLNVADSTANYKNGIHISYCLPKNSDLKTMVWRFNCN